MGNYKSLRRYYLIIEKLREGRGASFRDISEHLKRNDVSISQRTLQRDIAQIRADFSIDIIYHSSDKTYRIDESASIDLPNFLRFLELSLSTEFLKDQYKHRPKVLDYVHFEPVESLKGHENLKPILDAIVLKRWLQFSYRKFSVDELKNHKIIPCLLKRYQNRWYLIGKNTKGTVLTFGIDRMFDIVSTQDRFHEKDQDLGGRFEHIVGINCEGDPERVVLQVDSLQAKYLSTLPLHSSQNEIKRSSKYTWFEYFLVPNYELTQEILRLSGRVKVIEPLSLKQEISSITKESMDFQKESTNSLSR